MRTNLEKAISILHDLQRGKGKYSVEDYAWQINRVYDLLTESLACASTIPTNPSPTLIRFAARERDG